MREDIKLVAFDLDGTLTQHKTKLDDKNALFWMNSPSIIIC